VIKIHNPQGIKLTCQVSLKNAFLKGESEMVSGERRRGKHNVPERDKEWARGGGYRETEEQEKEKETVESRVYLGGPGEKNSRSFHRRE